MGPGYQSSKCPVYKATVSILCHRYRHIAADEEMLTDASDGDDIVMSSPGLACRRSRLLSTCILIDFDNDIIMGNSEDSAAIQHLEPPASLVGGDLMDIDVAGWAVLQSLYPGLYHVAVAGDVMQIDESECGHDFISTTCQGPWSVEMT